MLKKRIVRPFCALMLCSLLVMIAAGMGHGLACRSDGVLFAWGDNSHGQLGDGTTMTRAGRPVRVEGVDGNIVGIACGIYHSVALAEVP